MRYALTLSALLMGSAALSETFSVDSAVSAVTLYPTEARITRSAELEVPAGRHRIVIGGLPFGSATEALKVSHPGLERVGLYLRQALPLRDSRDTPERQAALARLTAVEAEIAAVRRAAAEARLEAEGARAAIGFVEALGRGRGGTIPAADQLRDLLTTIAQEVAEARQVILAAEARSSEIEAQLADLDRARAAAQAELEALSQQAQEQLYLALEVTAPHDLTVPLTLAYPAENVGWSPVYDIDLVLEPAPQVTLRRDIRIWQETGEDWTGVALRVSTSTPDQRIIPGELAPEPRWIEDPQQQKHRPSQADAQLFNSAPAAVAEWADAAGSRVSVVESAAGVSYSFAQPVSLRSGAETAYLSLAPVTLAAEVTARATPLLDATAYRVARVSNHSGEELLASDTARFSLAGELIGQGRFDGLIPEAEAELGFGPIDGLRVSRDLLDRSEGGRGVISRSNQRNATAEIEVENLTDRVWPLRVLDRVPYSEQEDLEISWSASPTPSEENVDKQRGILAWDLEMQPGSTRMITLNTRLDWPEGKLLR